MNKNWLESWNKAINPDADLNDMFERRPTMRNADFLEGGKFDKFLVVKRADIQEYLHPAVIEDLYRILDALSAVKKLWGKNIAHKYLVINVDEPYAPEIVEILKRNGHWG